MAVSRFYDPKPVFFDNSGIVCAGGTLYFFEPDTVSAKHAFAEPELSTDLGVSVDLDASGRLESPVFLDGAYCAQLKDADDVQVWFQEDLGETDAGAIVALDPADGTDGQVYSTDGVDALWRDVLEVPDCTGNSGKYLGTDGTDPAWTAFPAATVYDEDTLPGSFTQDNDSSGSFTIGNIRVEWGNDTAPTSATVVSTKAVTFHTAFSGSPYYVGVTPTSGGVTSDTPSGRCSAQALSANSTGFTASMFAGAEDEGSGSTAITSTVAFNWLAIGPK